MDLAATSKALAEAAEAGRWDEAARRLWRRADELDGSEAPDQEAARAAYEAGERARAAIQQYRADLETEMLNLRAARRSTRAWRPYREASGGTVDLSS